MKEPRTAVERIVSALIRFVQGKGLIVKTRSGLIAFGQGLDDAEARYVRAVIVRALNE